MRLCREDDEMVYGTCSVRNEAIIPISGKSIEQKSNSRAYTSRHNIRPSRTLQSEIL